MCVDTLRNKHLHDNNSDGTECPTLVGTNNEPNKIKAINYSRSIKVTITCKVEHLTCFVTSIHWLIVLLKSGKLSQCNETIKTDFGVSKFSQKQNRPKTKQTHKNRKEISYSTPQTKWWKYLWKELWEVTPWSKA